MKFLCATSFFIFYFFSLAAQPRPDSEKSISDSFLLQLPVDSDVIFFLGKIENPDVLFLVLFSEGRIAFSQNAFADDSGKVHLDISSLPAGIYIVEIAYDGKCNSVLVPKRGDSATCWRQTDYWEKHPPEKEKPALK